MSPIHKLREIRLVFPFLFHKGSGANLKQLGNYPSLCDKHAGSYLCMERSQLYHMLVTLNYQFFSLLEQNGSKVVWNLWEIAG